MFDFGMMASEARDAEENTVAADRLVDFLGLFSDESQPKRIQHSEPMCYY